MSIPKRIVAAASKEGKRLITHVMVEASLNVFRDEAAVTIYLRDVSHAVEVQKLCQQAIEDQIKEDAEEEIVEALAGIIEDQDENSR